MRKRNWLKRWSKILVILMVITTITSIPLYRKVEAATDSSRVTTNFNYHWKYYRGDPSGAEVVNYDDASWDKVSLPHTFREEALNPDGNYYRGTGWYRKQFFIDAGHEGKKVFIHFEGAMQVAKVWVNGTEIGSHVFGFTPFVFDISSYLNYGSNNTIAVRVNNERDPEVPAEKEGVALDYILTGGLYRDVELIVTDKLYIPDPVLDEAAGGGIFVKYPNVSQGSATVAVTTWVRNEYSQNKTSTVLHQLIDSNGQIVATGQGDVTLNANEQKSMVVSIDVSNPNLWSPSSPYLYTLRTTVMEGDLNRDQIDTRIGIRKIRFDRDTGFYINDKHVKLFGLNRHQMWPFVGNAAPNRLQKLDAQLLKDGGCNFIRTSHYPQDEAFLDACDELGIMVWEESPGGSFSWMQKPPTSSTWRANAIRSIRDMIRRDRNRPSVIIWGGINEAAQDVSWENLANDAMHEEDDTRPSSSTRNYYSSNHIFDVYGHNIFEDLPNANPDMGTSGYIDTEHTGHTFPTARFDAETKLLEHAGKHEYMTKLAWDRSWVTGTMGWSFVDYNSSGEQGYQTMRYHGVMDMLRVPKFAYYFYQSQRDQSSPMVHIANYWMANSPTQVKVYSNCDQVRLSKWVGGNWEVFATQNPDSMNVGRPPFTFNLVNHDTDRLRAEGLISGNVVSSHIVRTPDTPTTLSLEASHDAIYADRSDMTRVLVSVKDEHGTVVPTASNKIHYSISGPGEIIGDDPSQAEAGITGILVRGTDTPGTITLTATVESQPNNLALNKTITTDGAESWNPVINAVDGNESSRWCATDGNAGHWIQVDLGNAHNLSSSYIKWEQTGKVYKYKIEGSIDGNQWQTIVDRTGNTSPQQIMEDSFTASNVRYVKLTVTGLESGAWASLYEFKLFDGSSGTGNITPASVNITTMDAGITPPPVPETTYYVDAENGDDSNVGTSESEAWKTLTKVNSITYNPGDKILFKSGSIWQGQLWPKGSGEHSKPIVIDKYGTGNKPIINGGGVDTAVYLTNQSYWEINNLEVTNQGPTVTQRRAIGIFAKDVGQIDHIYIKNCDIHDVNGADEPVQVTQNGFTMDVKWTGGIIFVVEGSEQKTWYNDVLLENNTVKNVDRTGIRVADSAWFNRDNGTDTNWAGCTNVRIRNNVIDNVGGDGIVAQNCDSPIIEYNVAKDCMKRSKFYNVAIWDWSCKNALFQYNEAYLTRTTRDGQGFDCDYYSTGTTFQYNYSHDNEGGFMLICSPGVAQINDGSVIRYNISENDGTRTFQIIGGGTKNTKIYNNVIYIDANVNCSKVVDNRPGWGDQSYPKDVTFTNNIFAIKNGATFDSNPLFTYDYNCFDGVTGPTDSHKVLGDPQFVNPNSGAIGIQTVAGYKLQETSPCINAGTNIANSGGKDYWGNTLYNNNADIGAHEYQGTVTPPTKILLYYVDCGDDSPSNLEAGESLGTHNSLEDQAYGSDPSTSHTWGYSTHGDTWSRDVGDTPDDSLRTDEGDTEGKGLTYRFAVDNGEGYKLTLGFKDPWDVSDRSMDIVVEGVTKTTGYVPGGSATTQIYDSIQVDDGILEVVLKRSVGNTKATTDPMLNWIKVERIQ